MDPVVPLPTGFGCMRLSTAADRSEEVGLATLRAALEAGATLLDTADAYCLNDRDVGHNERLIRRALTDWDGPVQVATKGGLVRPNGRWLPNGRAKHLLQAAEASRERLGVDCIDLYQLHVPDPRTKLATSVRALKKLKKLGVIRGIGLCNVTLAQLREARALVQIDAVQVAISPWVDDPLRNGVAEECRRDGILLMAYAPFGGPKKVRKVAKDPTFLALAERHGVTPHQVVLAWLKDLGIVTLPGASRPATAAALTGLPALDDADHAALDDAFPAGRQLRIPQAQRRPADHADGEVVVLMGLPASGKTTLVSEWTDRGYGRLNRDMAGGRLDQLLPMLDQGLADGERRWVLDNTYVARARRNRVIEVAWRHGVPVRCVWKDIPVEQALINAVLRMLDRRGDLLTPEQLKVAAKEDPNMFGPNVIFRLSREFEAPSLEEGFTTIDRVPFERTWTGTNRALFLQADTLPPDAVLRRYRDWPMLGFAWRPGGGDVAADLAGLSELPISWTWCPHPPGPPICWCRTPIPGQIVRGIVQHDLDPARCLLVGKPGGDRTMAERVGIPFRRPEEL